MCEEGKAAFKLLYPDEMSIMDKIEKIATTVYGASRLSPPHSPVLTQVAPWCLAILRGTASEDVAAWWRTPWLVGRGSTPWLIGDNTGGVSGAAHGGTGVTRVSQGLSGASGVSNSDGGGWCDLGVTVAVPSGGARVCR